MQASGILGPTGVDELASALLEFESGLTASLTCGVHFDVRSAGAGIESDCRLEPLPLLHRDGGVAIAVPVVA